MFLFKFIGIWNSNREPGLDQSNASTASTLAPIWDSQHYLERSPGESFVRQSESSRRERRLGTKSVCVLSNPTATKERLKTVNRKISQSWAKVQRMHSQSIGQPIQKPVDAAAPVNLEEIYNGFNPYDIVWEGIFSEFKQNPLAFQLDDNLKMFKDLIQPNTEGLNYTKARKRKASEQGLGLSNEICNSDVAEQLSGLFYNHGLYITVTMAECCLEEVVNTQERKEEDQFFVSVKSPCDSATLDDSIELGMAMQGCWSQLVDEAREVLKGVKIDAHLLLLVLKKMIQESVSAINSLLYDSDAELFVNKVVLSLVMMIAEHQELKHKNKKSKYTCDAMINIAEKVVYLCIRTGFQFTNTTKQTIAGFTSEAWSCLSEHQLAGLYSMSTPFLIHKLMIWDVLENLYHFDDRMRAVLFRQLQNTFLAVVSVSRTPLEEALEVAAMALSSNEESFQRNEEVNFFGETCLGMVKQGLQCEAMDDISFSAKIMEFHGNTADATKNPFHNGPIHFSLTYKFGDILCLAPCQNVLDRLWYGDFYRTSMQHRDFSAKVEISELFASDMLLLNRIHLSLYRKTPLFIGFFEFSLFFALLLSIYVIISHASVFENTDEPTYTGVVSYVLDVIYVLTLGLILKELAQVNSSGIHEYYSSFWNMQDTLIIFSIVFFVIAYNDPDVDNLFAARILTLMSLLLVLRLLYFALLFKSYGTLVSALFTMLAIAVKFLLFFILISLGFAVVMHSIFHNVPEFHTITWSLIWLFSSALNNFDYNWFSVLSSGYQAFGVMLLTVYVLISSVILFNMLVALLSDSFSGLNQRSIQTSAFARASLIRDFYEQPDLPAPFNVVSFLLNILSLLVHKNCLGCWNRTQDIVYSFFDFFLTVSCLAPLAWVADCFTICSRLNTFYHSSFHSWSHKNMGPNNNTFRFKRFFYGFAFALWAFCEIIVTIFILLFLYMLVLPFRLLSKPSVSSFASDTTAEFRPSQDMLTPPIMEPNAEDEKQFHANLSLVKEAMLKAFKFQKDEDVSPIEELDEKLAKITEMIEEEKKQVSKRFQSIEKHLEKQMSIMKQGFALLEQTLQERKKAPVWDD